MRISLYLLNVHAAEDAVDIDELAVETKTINQPFEATLFVEEPEASAPGWLNFLRDGFQDLQLAETVTHRAVLVLSVDDRRFAITFGHGYQLLRAGSYVRDFGLKTALGLVLNGGGADQLRSIDSKTISESPLRYRAQLLANAEIERFGFDVRQDLLKAVTGVPGKPDWGTRVSGKHALYLSMDLGFEQLPALCTSVMSEYLQQAYKGDFPWIDNISHVDDRAARDELIDALIEKLKNSEDLRRSFLLGPPEIVDWEKVAKLAVTVGKLDDIETVTFADYYHSLRADGRDKLSKKLLDSHRLETLDADDKRIDSWSVRRCIEGEFEHDGTQYVVADGEFYQVAKNYLDELDKYLTDEVPLERNLPPSRFRSDEPEKDLKESDYNEGVAGFEENDLWKEQPLWPDHEEYLLLDQRTVRIPERTTAVEVADLLAANKQLIHVKRHLRSAGLSHLFSQASVSSELLVASAKFRKAVEKKVKEECKQQKKQNNGIHNDFKNDFSSGEWTVTLAVVGPWKDRSLKEALPFFSKVNLRNCVRQLRSMGYEVAFERVEIVPDVANLDTPHRILGLREDSSEAEVKKQAKWLAKVFHPDKPGGDNELMAKVNAARDEMLEVAAE